MFDLTDRQKENTQWYEEHLKEVLENPKYKGKYLVIHEKSILASFNSEHHAIDFVAKELKSFDECIIEQAIDESEIVNFVNVQFQTIENNKSLM